MPESNNCEVKATGSADYHPELIFSLCAAVGTDTTQISEALAAELRTVGYEPVFLRLSSLMPQIPGLENLRDIKAEDERISESIKAGNEIRRIVAHADAVVRLALAEIVRKRASLNKSEDGTVPADRHCFIISSLKREEELVTLRELFGQRALLISVYEPHEQRLENLCRKIASSRGSSDPDAHREVAEDLIRTDQKERSNIYGQRMEDVFQRADVFLKAGTSLREDARRFIQLLFRAPYLTPNVDEILMFQARATAQRSADLSRQVGAVIATTSGEILATGCNEVPRAGGGVVWDAVAGTERDYRDYKVGQDAAAGTRKEIISELLQALGKAGWLVQEKKAKAERSPEDLAQEALFTPPAVTPPAPLAGTSVANLLEFGRIVHAEMAAICDAAMRGISVKEATLYCTTFPCHMCARHIIAAGIHRVVYIEPYPKSRAKKLYKRAIQVDHDREADEDAVKFEAFVGIAPTRFLDLFEMVARKDDQGYALSVTAPAGAPKGVTLGSMVADIESSYLAELSKADWSQLEKKSDDSNEDVQSTLRSDENC